MAQNAFCGSGRTKIESADWPTTNKVYRNKMKFTHFSKSVCKWQGSCWNVHTHTYYSSYTRTLFHWFAHIFCHRPFESWNLHLNLTSNSHSKNDKHNIPWAHSFIQSFVRFKWMRLIAEIQKNYKFVAGWLAGIDGLTPHASYHCRWWLLVFLFYIFLLTPQLSCCGVEFLHKNWLKAIIWNYHRIFILYCEE